MLPYCVQEFLSFCGPDDVGGIAARDVIDFYAWLQVRPLVRREGTLSGAMIDHYLYALRTFYSWLQATGQIDHNPVSGLRLPRLGAGERLPLDLAQIALLFDHARGLRERVLLHLFYSCGLRRSEAEALDISDVSLPQRLLYVRSGKGARRRVVPLAGRVAACLQHYYEGEREPLLHVYDTDSLLLNRAGQRLRGNSMNDIVQTIGQRARLEEVVTPHRLRHSIATHLLGRGMELEQVRVFLGHGSLDTTQIYARVAPDNILAL
jgi:site-specific recombinase XerD